MLMSVTIFVPFTYKTKLDNPNRGPRLASVPFKYAYKYYTLPVIISQREHVVRRFRCIRNNRSVVKCIVCLDPYAKRNFG